MRIVQPQHQFVVLLGEDVDQLCDSVGKNELSAMLWLEASAGPKAKIGYLLINDFKKLESSIFALNFILDSGIGAPWVNEIGTGLWCLAGSEFECR